MSSQAIDNETRYITNSAHHSSVPRFTSGTAVRGYHQLASGTRATSLANQAKRKTEAAK